MHAYLFRILVCMPNILVLTLKLSYCLSRKTEIMYVVVFLSYMKTSFHEMQLFICNTSEPLITTLQLILYLKRLSLAFEYGQCGSKYKYRHLGVEISLSYSSMQSISGKWMGNTGYHKNIDAYNFREGTVHSQNAISNKCALNWNSKHYFIHNCFFI